MEIRDIIAGILGGLGLLLVGFLTYTNHISSDVTATIISSVVSGVVFYLFGLKAGEVRVMARMKSKSKEDKV